MIETRFKKTEIGEIPEDWEVKAFTEICSLKHGFQFRDFHFSNTGIKIVKIGNLSYNGKLDFTNVSYIAENDSIYYSDFKLLKGDILMALTGATLGKCSIVLTNEQLLQNYRVGNFTNKEGYLKQYIYYLLNSKYIQSTFNNFVNQAAQPNIGKRDFDKMFVPTPTFLEQQRIATALSDIDTLLSALNKKIEKKKLVKQGAMRQLLTGEKRLAGFTEPWEEKTLGEVCCNSSYGVGAEAIPYNGVDKYIRITDIADESGRFIPSPLTSPSFYDNNYIVQENDLLIARTGASVGKTYLYAKHDGRLIFAGFLMRINIINAHSKYVFYQTQAESYKKWVNSESMRSGQPGLNMQQLLSCILVFPPTLAEQTAIATILSDMDKEIEELEVKRAKYEQVKRGMMQQLLTGKIRLISKV